MILIGHWVRRERRGLPHLVESIVSGDAITRCGRRLTNEPTQSGGALLPTLDVSHPCALCTPKED